MKTAFPLLPLMLVCFAACNDAGKKAKDIASNTTEADSASAVPSKKEPDTLTIATKCAVAWQPDSLAIEKRLAKGDEEAVRAGMDDYLFLMNESVEFLEKQGIAVVDAKDKTWLKFLYAGNNSYLVKLDTLSDLWGIFLFDPGKAPLNADISDIELDYKSYYSSGKTP